MPLRGDVLSELLWESDAAETSFNSCASKVKKKETPEVLIVANNIFRLMAYSTWLQAMGCNVICAKDGRTGVLRIQERLHSMSEKYDATFVELEGTESISSLEFIKYVRDTEESHFTKTRTTKTKHHVLIGICHGVIHPREVLEGGYDHFFKQPFIFSIKQVRRLLLPEIYQDKERRAIGKTKANYTQIEAVLGNMNVSERHLELHTSEEYVGNSAVSSQLMSENSSLKEQLKLAQMELECYAEDKSSNLQIQIRNTTAELIRYRAMYQSRVESLLKDKMAAKNEQEVEKEEECQSLRDVAASLTDANRYLSDELQKSLLANEVNSRKSRACSIGWAKVACCQTDIPRLGIHIHKNRSHLSDAIVDFKNKSLQTSTSQLISICKQLLTAAVHYDKNPHLVDTDGQVISPTHHEMVQELTYVLTQESSTWKIPKSKQSVVSESKKNGKKKKSLLPSTPLVDERKKEDEELIKSLKEQLKEQAALVKTAREECAAHASKASSYEGKLHNAGKQIATLQEDRQAECSALKKHNYDLEERCRIKDELASKLAAEKQLLTTTVADESLTAKKTVTEITSLTESIKHLTSQNTTHEGTITQLSDSLEQIKTTHRQEVANLISLDEKWKLLTSQNSLSWSESGASFNNLNPVSIRQWLPTVGMKLWPSLYPELLSFNIGAVVYVANQVMLVLADEITERKDRRRTVIESDLSVDKLSELSDATHQLHTSLFRLLPEIKLKLKLEGMKIDDDPLSEEPSPTPEALCEVVKNDTQLVDGLLAYIERERDFVHKRNKALLSMFKAKQANSRLQSMKNEFAGDQAVMGFLAKQIQKKDNEIKSCITARGSLLQQKQNLRHDFTICATGIQNPVQQGIQNTHTSLAVRKTVNPTSNTNNNNKKKRIDRSLEKAHRAQILQDVFRKAKPQLTAMCPPAGVLFISHQTY